MKEEIRNSYLSFAIALGPSLGCLMLPQQAIDQPIRQIYNNFPQSDRGIPLNDAVAFPEAAQIEQFTSTIEKEFGIPGSDLTREISGQDSPAYAWSLVNLIEAYRTASLVPGISEKVKNLYKEKLFSANQYWDSGMFGPGYDGDPDVFFSPIINTDDTNWLGIQQLREGNIDRAKQALELSIRNWDPIHGGVYWQDQNIFNTNKERGTVSTATASILSSGLYQTTGDPKYLEFAERTLDWVLNTMTNDSGLMRDHDEVETILPPDTTHQNDVWSYNQGVTITALSLLNEVNPQKYPLSRAVDLLKKSLDYFERTGYDKQPAYFNSRFFKDALGFVSKVPELKDEVLHSLGLAREAGPKHSSALIFHAAMLQMQALALLDPSQYYLLIDRAAETRYQMESASKNVVKLSRDGYSVAIYNPNA